MNYKNHYDTLIEHARDRKIEDYTEVHHIVPRCIGGTDDKTNLVRLTAREHFVAHQLLVKMYPKHQGLISAVFYMTCGNTFRSNRIYEWHRKRLSLFVSELQSGEGNSQYGTRWIHNFKLKKSKKIPKKDILPKGWSEGRVINFDRKEKTYHKRKDKTEQIRKETIEIFRTYIESDYTSLNNFCKNECSISLVALTKRFKKYIDGYCDMSKQGSSKLKEKYMVR